MSGRDPTVKPPLKLYVGIVVLAALALWRLVLDPVDETTRTGVLQVEGAIMGTSWGVKVVPPEDGVGAVELRRVCETALSEVDRTMSTYKADSELSRFNRHHETTPFEVSAGTAAVFALAEDVSRLTDGAFDVTVRPLVDAWGFGPDGELARPDAARLDALKASVGWERIRTDASAATLTKTHKDTSADLSAIAKGWAVDQVALALEEAGHAHFMVEVGGEVRTRGHNAKGEPWRIGVEVPATGTRSVHTIVPLSGQAMATSGDYRNYREVEGRRVSHTIDPRTGRPIEHGLASVTVVADTCARADALATALNVLGPEPGLALAEAQGVAAMFLVRTKDDTNPFATRTTPSFEALGATTPSRPKR